MTLSPARSPFRRPARAGILSLHILLLSPGAFAADGRWAGTLDCTDGWGNPVAVPVEGETSGQQIRIRIGSTRFSRPIDANGEFTVGLSLGRDERVAHLRGTIGASLTFVPDGGEVVCAGSIASADAPAVAAAQATPAAAPAPGASPAAPPSPAMLAQAEPRIARASARVADVVELLQRERENAPARLQAARAVADAPEPQGGTLAQRADFLARRAFAAWALDREDQARTDFARAYDVARAERSLPALDRTWFQYHLGLALFRTGEFVPAMQLLRESIADLKRAADARSGEEQRRLLWHLVVWQGFLTNAHVATGDLAAAETALGDAESGFALLTSGPTAPHERALAEAAVAQARASIATLRGDPQGADEQHRVAIRALATHTSWPKNRWLPVERIEQITLEAVLARAETLAEAGRSDEAVALARQVVARLAEGPAGRPAETASAARVLAETLAARGRPADAAALAALALDVLAQAAPGRGTPLRIRLHLVLAQSEAAQGRWAEARMVYDALRAELAGDRTRVDPRVQTFESAAGSAAATRFEQALRADPTYALSLLRTGQTAAARQAAETAEAQARQLYGERHVRTAEAGAVLAAALAETGQRDAALARFRASMPTLIAAGVEASDADTPARSARLRVVAESYLRALAQTLRAGAQGLRVDDPQLALVEEMMRAAEAARSRRLLESIAASIERSGLADAGLADLVRREQDSGRRIRALYDSLAGLYALPAAERGRQDTVLREQIEETESARAALRRQIAQRRPTLAAIARPAPPTLAELRRALKPEEALVALFVGDKRSYGFAVPKQGPVAVVEAPIGGDAVIEAVVLLRAAMMAEGSVERLPAFDARSAYERLYAPLLQPLEPAFAGARELLVVADGALTQLPWSLLPTGPAAPAAAGGMRFAEYAAVPWLIRRQAVVHLPSATALVALRRTAPAARPPRPFVGFGDPVFTADARAAVATRGLRVRAALPRQATLRAPESRMGVPRTLGRSAAIEAVESLPALPDTRAELQQIARELGANVGTELFLGPRASESEVRRARLQRYRVVAFATHGLAPGDIDGLLQPALALSSPRVTAEDGDGLLTMSEVLELRLAADWVVLSACNTAGAAEPGADVLSGLASAFFYSGARSLLVTHWAVETVSARLMTTGTFAAKGLSRAEALRQAMLALIDGKAGQGSEGGKQPFSYAHPVFWAPFAIVGDAG